MQSIGKFCCVMNLYMCDARILRGYILAFSNDSHFYIQPEGAKNAPHKRIDGCLNFRNDKDVVGSNSKDDKYELLWRWRKQVATVISPV